jgi:O-antigen ligase
LFTALFFTFTRGAWIAVIIELSILVFLFLKKYRVLLLVSTVVVFLIVVGLSYKSIISHKLITRGSEQPRIEAIKLSSEIIRKHPFVGIGYGKDTFSKYYPDIYVKHSHNIFLNTAVETGIPGLAVLIAMFGIVMKNLIRAILHETDFEKKLILSGIFASFIGFLCLNTFDYMYHGWPGQMFWMLIGIGSGLQKNGAGIEKII